MKSILIYKKSASMPGGKAYLCADGSLTSERSQAQEHWDIQFDAVVAENWIVQPAEMEIVERTNYKINTTETSNPMMAARYIRGQIAYAEKYGRYVYCDTPAVSLRIIDARCCKGVLEVKTIGKGIWEPAPHNIFADR